MTAKRLVALTFGESWNTSEASERETWASSATSLSVGARFMFLRYQTVIGMCRETSWPTGGDVV
jgi:hypothetical protein